MSKPGWVELWLTQRSPCPRAYLAPRRQSYANTYLSMFAIRTAWWHTDFIHVALQAVEAHTYQEPRGHLALLHVSFDSNGAPCSFHEDITGRRRPWTCLPEDWLSKTTAAVISSGDNTHFIAVAIFGPQKLVVVYDGAAGLYDAPGLWEVRIQQLPDAV